MKPSVKQAYEHLMSSIIFLDGKLRYPKPGGLVERLSKEDREAIKELKAEDIEAEARRMMK